MRLGRPEGDRERPLVITQSGTQHVRSFAASCSQSNPNATAARLCRHPHLREPSCVVHEGPPTCGPVVTQLVTQGGRYLDCSAHHSRTTSSASAIGGGLLTAASV